MEIKSKTNGNQDIEQSLNKIKDICHSYNTHSLFTSNEFPNLMNQFEDTKCKAKYKREDTSDGIRKSDEDDNTFKSDVYNNDDLYESKGNRKSSRFESKKDWKDSWIEKGDDNGYQIEKDWKGSSFGKDEKSSWIGKGYEKGSWIGKKSGKDSCFGKEYEKSPWFGKGDGKSSYFGKSGKGSYFGTNRDGKSSCFGTKGYEDSCFGTKGDGKSSWIRKDVKGVDFRTKDEKYSWFESRDGHDHGFRTNEDMKGTCIEFKGTSRIDSIKPIETKFIEQVKGKSYSIEPTTWKGKGKYFEPIDEYTNFKGHSYWIPPAKGKDSQFDDTRGWNESSKPYDTDYQIESGKSYTKGSWNESGKSYSKGKDYYNDGNDKNIGTDKGKGKYMYQDKEIQKDNGVEVMWCANDNEKEKKYDSIELNKKWVNEQLKNYEHITNSQLQKLIYTALVMLEENNRKLDRIENKEMGAEHFDFVRWVYTFNQIFTNKITSEAFNGQKMFIKKIKNTIDKILRNDLDICINTYLNRSCSFGNYPNQVNDIKNFLHDMKNFI